MTLSGQLCQDRFIRTYFSGQLCQDGFIRTALSGRPFQDGLSVKHSLLSVTEVEEEGVKNSPGRQRVVPYTISAVVDGFVRIG